MGWRILGKRVRSKGQLAPLLSHTPHAYPLWAIQNGSESEPSPQEKPAIVALVNASAQTSKLEETLARLSTESIEAYVIGSDHLRDIAKVVDRVDWSQNPWFMPIGSGDILALGAAKAYREAMVRETADVIYADDDLLGLLKQRKSPHFKPSWNSELFKHHDFLTGACVVRGSRQSLMRSATTKAWAAELVSQGLNSNHEPIHIKKVLHYRRFRPSPKLPLPGLATTSELPRVSVVIPTRDRHDLLSVCIDGVMKTKEHYSSLEIIVVDNDSCEPEALKLLDSLSRDGVSVLRHPGPFNYSAINNRAVEGARGDLICLLNNDIEVIDPNWLAIMAKQAIRKDVGAVGAQLLYPDGRIQHAGVITGVGNAAGHAHRFLFPEEKGYFNRHALPQFVSAVTAACLVVRRDRFMSAGKLNSGDFPVAYNDVDLCLRLNSMGWQSLYEPRAALVHHESVSRGDDTDTVGAARFAGELAALKRLWHTDKIVDPFHHPQLSRASEQFAVAI